VGVTYPNGRELRYTYDGLDRIKAIAEDFILQPPLVEYDYICVIKDFAEGLHVFQDSFSHQGVPTFGRRSFGHGFTGEADDPHRPENRAIARRMSKRSYEEIVKLLKDCSCLKLTRGSPERERKHFASPDPYKAPAYNESQVSKYWEPHKPSKPDKPSIIRRWINHPILRLPVEFIILR
jgi:hypothetical protein